LCAVSCIILKVEIDASPGFKGTKNLDIHSNNSKPFCINQSKTIEIFDKLLQ
jgi:hypothetical protein